MPKAPRPVFHTVLGIRRSRRKVQVGVFKNREQMWLAAEEMGYRTRSGRAITVHMSKSRCAILFSRKCIGAEVIAHECVHAAAWLLRNAPKIRKFKFKGNEAKSIEENMAFWTGQLAKAIANEFHAAGLYK